MSNLVGRYLLRLEVCAVDAPGSVRANNFLVDPVATYQLVKYSAFLYMPASGGLLPGATGEGSTGAGATGEGNTGDGTPGATGDGAIGEGAALGACGL
jgi:hypothetical protein